MADSGVNLEELSSKISSLGEKVKSLKGDADKDAIAAAVTELLNAKRLYAQNNDGIGADGKKWEEPMTKAEKKAKAKAEKAAIAAAAAGATAGAAPTGDSEDKNSANAKKKALKKAEAKAKKVAMKAGGASGQAPASEVSKKPVARTATSDRKQQGNLSCGSLELKFNPNVPLSSRPVTALSVAVLCDMSPDLTLTSDHRISVPTMGLPSNGGDIAGDLAIARYLARHSSTAASIALLGGDSLNGMSSVDQWVDYASGVSRFPTQRRIKAISTTLECVLRNRTYLVGYSLTLADLAVFSALGFPSQMEEKLESPAAQRWVDMIASHPAIREATQLAVGVAQNAEAVFAAGESLDGLHEGMCLLEGATPGRVVTRFPPEPSGYLHIGHAKAILLNDYYATRYKGRLIVRFDDTNPSKEKSEYENSIVEDLRTLGVQFEDVTYTSDYFEVIKGYAIQIIQMGRAYMDDTPQELMQKERMERIESQKRNMPIEETLALFQKLCKGDKDTANYCLRVKMDMKSDNGTLRDPVIYRQNITPHHRTGTAQKAYPTYDLACPIVDSLEGVTHALRTTEYNDRDEQYARIQKLLSLRRNRIHSFARLNFMYTELSKRKLAWFVDNGHVKNWDDPRFPTVRGCMRRGVNVKALRDFICSQGASKRVVNMEWNKFWAENKKEIDLKAKRFMAIDSEDHVVLTITNHEDVSPNMYITTDYLPKDPSFGKRVIRLEKQVFLEQIDVEGMVVDEEIVLMRWGVVKITNIEGTAFTGIYLPNGDFKAAKRKLSWMADSKYITPTILTEFDNLISKAKLEEGDDFKDHINPNTVASSTVFGDGGLKTLQKDEVIQLERRGYYRVERPYLNDEKPLLLFMVPDGKSKPMSGLTGKLAHR